MNRKTTVIVLAALLGLGFALGRLTSSSDHRTMPEAEPSHEHTAEAAEEIWTCAMHPQIKLTKPGKCPICGMDLVPVAVEDLGTSDGDMPNLRRIAMSPAAVALADIETAVAKRQQTAKTVRMVGKVDYDETRVRTIASWVPGRIDRLYVDYTGVDVSEGDHLVYIYSPELRTAQEELLQSIVAARELRSSKISVLRESTEQTITAAREKLRLLGLTAGQIKAVERRGKASDHITIYSPIGGTVVHKAVTEGLYVDTGSEIYRIADLSKVWVQLDAYESDMAWIRYGQDVEFVTEAYPGEVFHGRVSFIDPILNPKTRTVKLRVNVDNADGKLKPEMFVRATLRAGVAEGGRVMDPALSGKWIGPMHPEIVSDEAGACPVCGMDLVRAEELGYVPASDATLPLVIPAQAPLVTGERAVVYVRVPDKEKPTFEGREVVLGARTGEHYIVEAGLVEGEEVVVKGNFKLDSALQIQARPSMMSAEGGTGGGGHDHGGSPKPAKQVAKAAEPMTAPKSFLEGLAPIFAAYHDVHAALSSDTLPEAKTAFGAVGEAARGVSMDGLEGHPHMLWMDLSQRLTNSAAIGEGADTLAKAREAFRSLSKELRKISTDLGFPEGESLVELHCPMAFAGAGGSWLQRGGEVRNPYFGQEMLTCGEVRERLGAPDDVHNH